jgi:hypothetical protein
MKIQINIYDTEVFKFVKAYLKSNEEEWLFTPHHRLVSRDFLRNLNDGAFDSIEYDVTFNPSIFNAEECLIVFRYWHIHKEMHKNYDKYVNIERIYSELGVKGSQLKQSTGKVGKNSHRIRSSLRHTYNHVNI